MNTWEQGGVALEDDIKEELSHDESSDEHKKVSVDEGSAAKRLLESMSKIDQNDNNDSKDISVSDKEFIKHGMESLILMSKINKSSNQSRFECRPYSPPFIS